MDDFLPLKMAVRVDREGRLMRDYHTAQEVLRADGKSVAGTVLSERFYLADADFLVGLERDRAFLEQLQSLLEAPVWTLFLGRKSFVPSVPICRKCQPIVEGELVEVLKRQPWFSRGKRDMPPKLGLRFITEVGFGDGEPRQDVPLSFVSRDRHFGLRYVQQDTLKFPDLCVHHGGGRMFLSKLILNVRHSGVRRDLAMPYEMHKTILCKGFDGIDKAAIGRGAVPGGCE